MAKGTFLSLIKKVSDTFDELEELYTQIEELKILENLSRKRDQKHFIWIPSDEFICLHVEIFYRNFKIFHLRDVQTTLEEDQFIGGRRVADAIVVSTGNLLCLVLVYLVGYIDRGGSIAGSSASLDFRDIYISIVLFQAAYVWIKFRDVIPRGAVYERPNSNKFEPRIKFPVTRGVGGRSKRIPLGSFDTSAKAEVAYQIAAFYCNKPGYTGRLKLAGGAFFSIPALSVGSHLPYEEKREQVGKQVLRVYAEFEEQNASTNLLPARVPGVALEMSNGEAQHVTTSPIQQLRQPLNSGMESAMPGEGSQPPPIIHNRVDFNNPSSAVLAETQFKLIEAYEQIKRLNGRVSEKEVENMRCEVKHSELEGKYSELEKKHSELEGKHSELEGKHSELECENGQLKDQIMESLLQPLLQELDFDPDMLPNMGHEE